ncbi:MAG: hypothetical protein LBK43_02725 [Treponema sp.]|jgi:hypothetical protein|nr:hypothetical protein [Treponema sp.]
MEITKEAIMENINEPKILEDLYQSNKKAFSEIIKTMYDHDSSLIIKYWYTRLFYKSPDKKKSTTKYIFTTCLIIFTWLPVRLIFVKYFENIDYLIKMIPIIFSVALSLFFLFGNIKIKNVLLTISMNLIVYIYLIILPNKENSQSLTNIFYFSFVIVWFFILLAQSNYTIRKLDYGIFLEKTGETIIWSTIFIIGGSIIVWLSLALFHAIGIDAHTFYLKNIVPLGLVASPFVSLLVIDKIDRIKLSIIIANIFLPLILVSLAVFGIISIFTEAKPYEERDIFIIYNIMMVIVICVLIFTSINGINNKIIEICSYILPIVTIILDIITISAVIYRLNKYGITPNKITLLGTNIIMLGHLIYMSFLRIKNKIEMNTAYLPLYFVWAICVVFIFPFIFKMA